jgi:hypothetical protein
MLSLIGSVYGNHGYGNYEFSEFSIDFDGIHARIEERDAHRYIREGNGYKEKTILGSGRIIVNPVEPVNLPKELTNFLQIKLGNEVTVEPRSSTRLFLTFPIEVGVFLAARRDVEVLDIFSLNKPKYALYGNPRKGTICRYWESGTSSNEVDCKREGLLNLRIRNDSNDWVEVGSVVFDVFGMKIYFSDEKVVSLASMNITSPRIAETNFTAELPEGMKKSLELYTARKIPMMARKFVMEWGF